MLNHWIISHVLNLKCPNFVSSLQGLDRAEIFSLRYNKEILEAETFELYSSEIPRRCIECTSSFKTVSESQSVLEEVQMASEGCLHDSHFSGTPNHHIQPATSEAEAGVLNVIVELGTFWSTQASSWVNTDAAEHTAQTRCLQGS